MPHRIKIDQDLPVLFAGALREVGHDAVTVVDQAMSGAADSRVWDTIQAEGRCLWTADVAFAAIRGQSVSPHHGIVLFRARRESLPMYLSLLHQFMQHPAFDDALSDTLVVVTPDRVRVHRRLPAADGGPEKPDVPS